MRVLIFIGFIFSSLSWAQDLPNPLTLKDVVKIANKHNFDQKQQQLNIDKSKLKLNDWESQYDTRATLDLELANRSEYSSGTNNSHGFVYLKKTLYDQNIEIGKDTQLESIGNANLSFQQLQQNKIINIMRSFFDIILADMSYETALEKLAMSAIREGRVKDDYDIQQASEVELLEKQTNTQISQIQRIKTESKQIQTRANLAQLLNINYEQRPDDVVKPDFKKLLEKKLAEFEHYQKQLTNNPKLKQLEQSLKSIKRQISQEKDNLGIVLSSNARLGEQAYQRDKNGKWHLGINLSMPFGTDSKQDNKISQLQIQAKQQQLQIEQHQQSLIGMALDYYLKLKSLQQIHKALIIELDYRDLYLEKARANYELEIKSDIGNAMVNYTDSEKKLAENEFDYVITLMQLHYLIGEDYEV